MNNTSQRLATQIWTIANELRGNMDSSKFKDYILGIIFYRYLSTMTKTHMDDLLKNDELTYEKAFNMPEFKRILCDCAITDLGYVIEPEYLFDSLVNDIHKGAFTIEKFETAISKLIGSTVSQRSEKAFENLFDAMNLKDSDLGREVSDRTKLISKIILKISDTPFAKDKNSGDILGTAYMILIGLFQSNAGKKGGEFFTPTSVSTLLAQLTTIDCSNVRNVSDGCAGSGSLLLEVLKQLPENEIKGVHFYAQEKTGTTYNLLRMNLIMHGVSYEKFSVFNDDTLVHDNFYENSEPVTFDIQVENPPYSAINTASDEMFLDDPRYKSAGVLAPKSKADMAFVESMVYHMAEDGRVAVLLPHGVLFRGGSELEIRKYLIDKLNVVDAIIGLPSNMFHGTGIPVCIIFLKKKRNGNSGNILFVDAAKYYEKEGKNNVLRPSDIKRIVDCVKDRSDIEGLSKKVDLKEVRENDYNLNIPRYVNSLENEDSWNLYSLMFGGVPETELKKYSDCFAVFNNLKEELFNIDGFSCRKKGDIREIVYENTSVKKYINGYKRRIEEMRDFLRNTLIDHIDEVDPKKTEEVITEELFKRISDIPLIDKYEAYQALYERWSETSDDIEIIKRNKDALRSVEPNVSIKKKNGIEYEESDGLKGTIFPFELVQKILLKEELRKLEKERDVLSEKEEKLKEIGENLTEEEREYEIDDLPICDAEKNELSGKGIAAAMKAIKKEYGKGKPDSDSIEAKIIDINDKFNEIKIVKKTIKEAEEALSKLTAEKIRSLTDEEIVKLLEEKWINPFVETVSKQAETVINSYIKDIEKLCKKYEFSVKEEEEKRRTCQDELISMLQELRGNEEDEAGIKEFISFLRS